MAEYDEGAYYEVQLNNKQLVFFFMATLAIAVVVFLCGVMVGRGVRDATLAAAQNDITADSRAKAPTPGPAEPVAKPVNDYHERLSTRDARHQLVAVQSDSPETAAVRKTPPPKPATATPPPVKPKTAPKTVPPRPSTLGGSNGAYTIQVVALKTPDAAKSLLGRLQSKNYRAYMESGEDAGLHRVRVGRFPTRREAEIVMQKLRDEEKFKPYITQ